MGKGRGRGVGHVYDSREGTRRIEPDHSAKSQSYDVKLRSHDAKVKNAKRRSYDAKLLVTKLRCRFEKLCIVPFRLHIVTSQCRPVICDLAYSTWSFSAIIEVCKV